MSQSFKRQKSSTTRLSAALQEELGLEVKSNGARGRDHAQGRGYRGGRAGSGVVGRKEARKPIRQDKRVIRGHVPVSKEVKQPQKFVNTYRERIDAEGITDPKSSKGKARDISRPRHAEKPASTPKDVSFSRAQRKHVDGEEATPLQHLMRRNEGGEYADQRQGGSSDTKRKRKRLVLSVTEQQEEDEIAWLEAHLGSKVGKTKPQKMTRRKEDEEAEDTGGGEDGLDDLLEDLDRFYPGMYDEEGTDASRTSGTEQSVSSEYDQDDSSERSSSAESRSNEVDFDDQKSQSVSIDEELESMSTTMTKSIEMPDQIETSGEGKYIPPALRKKLMKTQDDGSKMKLQRQAKGLLNRLGEGNLDVIVTEILDTLYRQFSRADVTDTLTKLIIQTISSSSNLVDSFVILHATLVTSLHRLVGIEFGAHFLQTVMEAWTALYDKLKSTKESQEIDIEEGAAREVKNLTSLISHLYNVGLIACPLIFDIIRLLLNGPGSSEARTMTEIDVELLYKIVKSSGQQLRHDDATSLKTITQLASQSSISNASQISSSRSRFMLEALENLKNHRAKSSANQSLEQQNNLRMKKYLSGLSRKRIVRTQEPLRVSLKDLQDADKKGRWWLVGAAWAGHESEATKPNHSDADKEKKEGDDSEAKAEALRDIARKHGMNTSIRQDIFVILISSQDYLDALERLQSLKFKKEVQRREIIRVLLHCIGSEVNFNPYYVILASRLAIDDIGTRYTLQYCLWDFMRELGEKKVGGRSIVERQEAEEMENLEEEEGSQSAAMTSHRIANVARAYGWWFAKGALSLSATKVVNYTNLKSKGVSFLQQVLVHLCLSVHATSPALTLRLVSKMQSNEDAYMKTNARSSASDDLAVKTLESLLVKGTMSNATHSQGLLYFLERYLKRDDCIQIASKMGASKDSLDHLLVSRNVMKQIVKVGASSAATLDTL